MRCVACDVLLSDSEAVKKDTHGEYVDMCATCLRKVLLPEFYEFSEDDPLAGIVVPSYSSEE